MRGQRPRIVTRIVLDCPYFAWRLERRDELADEMLDMPVEMPEILPFTFDDVPPALVGGDHDVLLQPIMGVKS